MNNFNLIKINSPVNLISEVKRTRILKIMILFIITSLLTISAAEICPFCKLKTIEISTIHDDINIPSKNLCVWNRSMCGNLSYPNNSNICGKCWFSYNSSLKLWEKSVEDKKAFVNPLSNEIENIPLPDIASIKSRVVYTKEFKDGKISEKLAFWCKISGGYVNILKEYCLKNKIKVTVDEKESVNNGIYITIIND